MQNNSKKLKVLMINHEFPPIGGGGGTTTRFLAKYLAKLGVEVSIATAKPGNVDFQRHSEGYSLYYIGPIKTKIQTSHIPEMTRFILLSLLSAKKIIKNVQPDLIHCFFSIPAGCFGLYSKKVFNIPYITSTLGADVPGFDIGDWRLNVYHGLTRYISKAIWDNSSHVIANSHSLKSLCEDFSEDQRIEVISNGVDTSIFYPNEARKNINPNEITFLFAGRLIWQKGIEQLIEACGILKFRGVTNFKLKVVGDGYLKDKMFHLINKYQIKEKVEHLGWKRLEELPDIYRSSDIFVLPSTMEGMPSVALQAMSCGLPVIATKVPGFEELVEEGINGFSAKYNDPKHLADCIQTILKSPELIEKMSKESIKKAKEFSWESIAEKYLEIYEKTLNRDITRTRDLVSSPGSV